MKKVFFIGLLALVCMAIYYGIVTLKAGDGELAIGFDGTKAERVVEDVKNAADKALEKVKTDEK